MAIVYREMILAAIVFGFAAHGCLDFTPITNLPVTANDASPVDGGTDGALSGKQAACLACTNSGDDAGGCASTSAVCSASPACKTALQCLTEQCVAGGNLTGACLSACETDAGVTSGPASQPFSSLLSCLIDHCQASCI